MGSILHKIGTKTQKRIDLLKQDESLEALKERAMKQTREPRSLREAFADGTQVNIIAEFKRASPSKGDIAPDLNHLDVAEAYLSAGATGLSVLTEPEYFRGDLQFIRDIRDQHDDALILMKDFFVDSYQLYQALEAGADAILIIVGLLGKERSSELMDEAKSLGLSVLMEVHDQSELEIALDLKPDLLGINNRDLRDLTISLDTSVGLSHLIPNEQFAISESGIENSDDIKRLMDHKFRGFLIGTSLMRTGEPGKALSKLTGVSIED